LDNLGLPWAISHIGGVGGTQTMATAAFSGVLWHLRSKADSPTRTDDELLDRFRNERDEAAIFRQHGPML